VDVAGAILTALLVFTAVPAVLVLVVGNPLSGGLGHAWRPLSRDALCVLALAAWIAWAFCCAQLLRGVTVRVRAGDARTVVGASVMDRLATRIAIGVLALSGIGAPLALTSSAGAAAPTARPGISQTATAARLETPATVETPDRQSATDDVFDTARRANVNVHIVVEGETLSGIAAERLDDAAAWPELAARNLGGDMGEGARFVDPDQLRPGWRLQLPAHAHAPRPADRSGRAADAHRTGGRPGGRPGGGDGAGGDAGGGRSGGGGGGARLPELAALGIGSLACAALAQRSGRRRGPRNLFTADPDVTARLSRAEVPSGGPGLSEAAIDAATLLQRFHGVPALRVFESANALLARTVGMHEPPAPPKVRAICVGPDGVTFWLREATTTATAPPPFQTIDGGSAWRVGHDELDHQDDGEPYVMIALPVGSDADGTWLVCPAPGEVLPVLGPEAPALRRAARAAACAWSWADALVVVDDPEDPRLRAELSAGEALARAIVFFGDPTALPADAAARAAVVTLAPVAASDVTVLVDRHGATLHPLGRVVTPDLQSAEAARALDELAAGPVATEEADLDVNADEAGEAGEAHETDDENGLVALAPGAVEVRMLTMTPRIDGLTEELPPNRARRAVELVAYLALHHPDAVTSDRLRTRVLGSSDWDAASKTLFNTAYAARRAMGVDDTGAPLFPSGTRNGHYQVSARVTVDVLRASALAGAAQRQADPEAAMALYRAALDLVEGEPLANALAGYTWWEAEGHGGRIASVLVDAACALSELGIEAGRFSLARWGLERARLVEPYSEALSRAAMRLAAAEGDAERLRLEWRECQRRVDALDPGSTPSSRTESLYGELCRLVAVGARDDEESPAPLSASTSAS
jgi:DNA-binding SARP family transcriptional activator/uncharacterized membrane protein YgcG